MIWSMDADGGNARQLTVDPANDFSALVTPVGRGIVFLSDRSGTRQLWRIDIDGGNPVLLTRWPAASRSRAARRRPTRC